MRILSIDEIPLEWKESLNQTGRDRYSLFQEDLQRFPSLLSIDKSGLVKRILEENGGKDFPYTDITIEKANLKNIARLNRPSHMGVLLIGNDGVMKLLGSKLDMDSIQIPGDMDIPGFSL